MDSKRCINQQVKKNKIIIYLLFLFILSTTSAKFINDQKKLSLSISKINITGLF